MSIPFSSAPEPKSNHRGERIERLLVHLAAEFIVRESNGVSLITALRAEEHAHGERYTILVSIFPDNMAEAALVFLNRNAGEFREYVRTHARMRDLPHFEFALDYGEKNRQHLDTIGHDL